jgi:GT2 family glycosyltransferase
MASARVGGRTVADASFDVVMAAHNASPTIEAAIRSVLMQTRSDFELIVVDDGSTDDTVSKVDRFRSDPRVRLLRQENLGVSAARNAAIRAGRARYVTIFDSDDLLMPSYLECMGTALDSSPDAAFAVADAWRLDDDSGRLWRRTVMAARGAPRSVPADSAALLRVLVAKNFLVMPTIRRMALERVGRYREEHLAEDWELLLRLVAFGSVPVVVPGVLTVYRRNRAGSFTNDGTSMLRDAEATLRVFVEEHPAPADVKDAARTQIGQLRQRLERKAGHRERHPVLAAARRRLRRPAAVVRRDPLRRRPPREVSLTFPDLIASGR